MKRWLSTAVGVAVLSTFCVACDKIKPPQPQLQKPPAISGSTRAQGEREAFAQTAQNQLDALRNALSDIRAKASTANLKTKEKLSEEADKLEAELGETQQRLKELRSATAESWNQLKESFVQSLEMINTKIDIFRKNSA